MTDVVVIVVIVVIVVVVVYCCCFWRWVIIFGALKHCGRVSGMQEGAFREVRFGRYHH